MLLSPLRSGRNPELISDVAEASIRRAGSSAEVRDEIGFRTAYRFRSHGGCNAGVVPRRRLAVAAALFIGLAPTLVGK